MKLFSLISASCSQQYQFRPVGRAVSFFTGHLLEALADNNIYKITSRQLSIRGIRPENFLSVLKAAPKLTLLTPSPLQPIQPRYIPAAPNVHPTPALPPAPQAVEVWGEMADRSPCY
ncbi:hypothetical protein [Synechococcus sp. MIT S1220]|uniref:hypothetical protein n=1 Tax=Synechococcus sp. MIT S1220 TaxID=3082549 RepID=UPI0039AFF3F9